VEEGRPLSSIAANLSEGLQMMLSRKRKQLMDNGVTPKPDNMTRQLFGSKILLDVDFRFLFISFFKIPIKL
jgi:hypothetical protein